jgi:hypothetical protein
MLSVGQKVYLRPIGNNARGNNREVQERQIKRVGRKYFEAWDGKNQYTITKFYIKDNRQVTNYSADWALYFSRQEILDENERLELTEEIRKTIGHYGSHKLTLEQLRSIAQIVRGESVDTKTL